MKAKELIEKLNGFNLESDILITVWDGECFCYMDHDIANIKEQEGILFIHI